MFFVMEDIKFSAEILTNILLSVDKDLAKVLSPKAEKNFQCIFTIIAQPFI